MRILIATDHAGFNLKEMLIPFVKFLGHEVVDYGAYIYDKDDDYPDMISKVARQISKNPDDTMGIVLGGSGQGEAIMANRFPNVRAIVFNGQCEHSNDVDLPNEIIISRQHNDSNIISLGARFLSEGEAKAAVKSWLETKFSGEKRHIRRLEKIDKITKSIYSKASIEIIPAIMPESFDDLNHKYSQVKDFAQIVQIDVMDGKFVPSKSWPYKDNINASIQPIDFTFEVDMMVSNPGEEVSKWIEAGAKRVIVHIESVENMDDIFIKIPSDIEFGVAINTTTPNNKLYPLIEKIDFVQFMGIEKIGYQGQFFDERVLDKIADLRKKYSRIVISVDGSVNLETSSRLKNAGVNRLVVGSAIFESSNIDATMKELNNN